FPALANRPHAKQIGLEWDIPIFIDEKRGGCVVEAGCDDVLPGSTPSPERDANADVEKIFAGLTIYPQYRFLARRTPTRGLERKRLVSSTKKKLRDIDPTAFSNAEHFWAVVFEQMHYGFL